MTEKTLQGKVALVTGASSGIGEATAVALVRAGATVAIAARRVDRLAELEKRLVDGGATVLSVDLDVTDHRSCRDAVDATVAAFGGLDIVINNAGVMLLGPIVGADIADWTRMIDTNLYGVLYMTHAALPHLLASKGTVVQISSVAGRQARAGSGVYNASKWGVNAFSESLRQEVTDKGVRVVLIEPGMAATELREHTTVASVKEALDKRAAGMRQLQPIDIADAVLYAVTQPAHVAINEILVRPTDQVQ